MSATFGDPALTTTLGSVNLDPSKNLLPEHFSDAEWQQLAQQYNGMLNHGYLAAGRPYTYPYFSWRPFPDRPTLFFDDQGKPTTTFPGHPIPNAGKLSSDDDDVVPDAASRTDWSEPAPVDIAAAGDLKCQGVCRSGGNYGTTGMFSVGGKTLCEACAVKKLGIENESPEERLYILMRYLLR
jgi:hypothetical protein